MAVPRHERGATTHGQRRIRKRLKLPARAIARAVDTARRLGLTEESMPSWMKLVVARKRELHPDAVEYRLHDGHLWVFAPDTGDLVTVYPVEEHELDLRDPDWELIRATRRFH